MAEALYRKYRPQVFEDVVGQDHIERTIKNAISKDQVSHAYLFCGPRGTGKTTTARLLAKALLCEHGPTAEPDGTCQQCLDIAEGVHPDVYELDAASRTGVENVRDEIIGRVNYAPTRGTYKIYIIDEVHMLSTAAFNALLKTLEEPPSHVVFILCTTDPQKVPETIHSRCQRFEFHRLSNDEIVTRLGAICVAEGVEFEGDALDLIAHRAEGGMRNALTSLEQLIAFGEGCVTVQGAEDLLGSLGASDMAEIIRFIGQRDAASCFSWTADYIESGADLAQFARDMAEHVRNLYVLSLVGTDAVLDVPDAERRQLTAELNLFGPDRLARLLGVLGDLISELRTSSNPRLCFEIALTRMVRPDADLTIEALAERIEALESGYSAVTTVLPHTTQVPPPPLQQAAQPAQQVHAAPRTSSKATQPPASTQLQPVSAPEELVSEVQVSAPIQETPPQEQPASPAASSAVSASSALEGIGSLAANPAALQRIWMSVTTAIKKEKQSFAALLVGVHAHVSQDAQRVVIEFPASNPISLSMARKPEMQELLTRAFHSAAGFPVPFELVQGQAKTTKVEHTSEAVPSYTVAESLPAVSAAEMSIPEASVPEAPAQVPDAYPGTEASFEVPAHELSPEMAAHPYAVEEPAAPFISESSDVPLPEPYVDEFDSAQAVPSSEEINAEDLSKMVSETFSSSIIFEEVEE